jgi:hypothetical protein
VICDLNLIRQLNHWKNQKLAVMKLCWMIIKTWKQQQMTYNISGADFNTKTIDEAYPQIVSWLNLIDTNVYIIIV